MGWACCSWVSGSVTVLSQAAAEHGGLAGLAGHELGSPAASSCGAGPLPHGLVLEHHQMPPKRSRLAPGFFFCLVAL